MKIAIIDAEIVGQSKHRFPNLCSMKLSSYHKQNGDTVELRTEYSDLVQFDRVYISKVFTKTRVPDEVLNLPNVQYGGTGFFYDNAPPLPDEVEHVMPDYHLYDEWISVRIQEGAKPKEFTYYTDYSIGYLTRKCFRGCYYCVNRNYRKVEVASALSEFMDPTRPKLCFLDDNFFGCPKWRDLIRPVIESGKRFQFKQGLDERLLTKDTVLEISKWRYDNEMIFAFDNIEDKDLITSKLELIRNTAPDWSRRLKFYVFCGCDKNDRYDEEFWMKDITDLFERIWILSKYGAYPYIMRFEKAYESQYSSFYSSVAAWCNQPAQFKKSTFRSFCQVRGMQSSLAAEYGSDPKGYLLAGGKKGLPWEQMELVESKNPDAANKYFDFVGFTNRT